MQFFAEIYQNVEMSGASKLAVDSMEALSQQKSIQELFQLTIELLNLRAGESFLDLGCGTCPDFNEVTKLLTSAGNPAFLDKSNSMLQVAKTKYGGDSGFILGDIQNLVFSDESFDCCRIVRTLQQSFVRKNETNLVCDAELK